MKVTELLAWLHVAALEEMSEHDIREVLEQVLDDAPDDGEEQLESFLDAIEDQLDAEEIETKVLLSWPSRFAGLLPKRMAPLREVEDDLEAMAEELPDVEVESPRLGRFKSCLETLKTAPDQTRAWAELESLESEIALALAEYSAEPFTPEAVSAESVAGHRFLRDGFACWFDAFHLAREGQTEEALACASEGNRLFRAVALWSDEVAEP